jgi:hypothetical protein
LPWGRLESELLVGHRIFEGLSDNEVQRRYRKAATFPDLDEEHLPTDFQRLIYACWSAEFGRYIALGKFRQNIDDQCSRRRRRIDHHPFLGTVGFSALGPVVGSAAVCIRRPEL